MTKHIIGLDEAEDNRKCYRIKCMADRLENESLRKRLKKAEEQNEALRSAPPYVSEAPMLDWAETEKGLWGA